MKILVVNKYWRAVGGVETHAFEVAAWLESLGHEVIPFAMQEESSRDDLGPGMPEAVEFRVSTLSGATRAVERAVWSSASRKSLKTVLARHKIDAAFVVHVYHQLGTVILNDLRAAGIPTVLSLHDYKVACGNYRFFSERTDTACFKCIEHRSGFLWAPVIERCWSGSALAGVALVAEAVATRARRSYQQPNIVLTTNALQDKAVRAAGIDIAQVRRLVHPVSVRRTAVVSSASWLIAISRLVPEKGLENLILASAATGTKVRIVGEGRLQASLHQLISELNAPVEMLGSRSLNECRELLQESAGLLVPSTWPEVSPLIVYDAIACGTPVAGSSVGGIVDQLEGGRGVLVEPGHVPGWAAAMSFLINDRHAATEMARRAQDFARGHWSRNDWESVLSDAFEDAGVSL